MATVVPVASAKTAPFSGAVVAALAIFINFVDRGNLATAAPLIKVEFTLSNTQIGMLISAFFWIYVPGQLLAAWLVSSVPRLWPEFPTGTRIAEAEGVDELSLTSRYWSCRLR